MKHCSRHCEVLRKWSSSVSSKNAFIVHCFKWLLFLSTSLAATESQSFWAAWPISSIHIYYLCQTKHFYQVTSSIIG
jgi:hypothetical protein